MLAELQKKFQTRLYRLDTRLTRIADVNELQAPPARSATRIGDSLKQLAAETADLPIGAVVLLSDGSDNSGGIDLDTISALRNRRIPVHTVGFGLEQIPERRGDRRRRRRAARAGRFAPLRAREFPPARLRRAQSHADRSRRRQSPGLARNHFRRQTARSRPKVFCSTPAPRARRRFSFPSTHRPASRIAPTTPSRGWSTSNPASAASCMSKASRAGNTNSSAAPKKTTASSRSLPCCAPRENKIYRQGINDPKELADGFPSRAEELFRVSGTHHRFGGSGLLHAAAAGADPRIRRPPRRRIAVSRGPFFAGRWRLGRIEPGRPASRRAAHRKEHVPSRSRDR